MKKVLYLISLALSLHISPSYAQNVGVDVASPVEKLDVLGAIRIGNTANTNAGTIRWNSPNFEGYNGSAWVNLGGGGTVTGTGTATRIAFWSGTSALSSNTNLFWDNTNNRLGIGTSSPSSVLDVINNSTAGYPTGDAKIRVKSNSTQSYGRFWAENDLGTFQMSGIAGSASLFSTHWNNAGFLYVSSAAPGYFYHVNKSTGFHAFEIGQNNDNAENRTEIMRINSTGVGIGTNNPGAMLEVAGQVKITGGTPGLNKVLTSDAAGLATWVDPTTLVSNAWKLTGNASTVDGTNFIGTTDNIPLTIKVNGQKAGRIDHVLFNTYLGYKAGNVSTGGYNTVMGFEAMPISTSAQGNIVNGYHAMYLNTTGSFNIVSGFEGLYSNTTGFENIAIGYQAMYSNINGQDNTAMGWKALYSNTSGTQNAAYGTDALYSNLTSSFNSAFGYDALYSNKSGNNGVAYGFRSQYYAFNGTSGWDNANTSIGYQSLMGSTTPAANSGNFNTAIGRNTLFANSSGGNNTAVGYTAGDINTTGSSNTFLGYNADAASNNLSNATAIGANASVTASNKVQIGDGSVTDVQLGTGTNVTLETGLVKITGGTPALNQVLTSDATGLASWEPAQGDNLGNHIATQNIQLNSNWLSNDGGSEGIRVDNNGNVGVGQTPGSAYLDITGTNAGTTSLQLRSGNSGSGTASNQVTMGFNGTENYRHAIKTRHNSGGNAGNAIDFYLWKFGTDAAGTVGTQHVMSIDGGNGGSIGIGTTVPSANLHVIGSGFFGDGTSAPAANTLNVRRTNTNSASWLSLVRDGVVTHLVSTGGVGRTADMVFSNDNSGSYIFNTGNIGIATLSPASRLAVVQNTNTTDGGLRCYNTTQATWTAVYTGGDNAAYFQNPAGYISISSAGSFCSSGGFNSCSDARYKTGFQPLTNVLQNLEGLNGYYYYWKKDEYPERKFSDNKQIGVIAQEIEKVYPEVVATGDDGYKTVDYSRLTPILLQAIKELNAEVNTLKSENTQFKTESGSQQNQLDALKAEIQVIKALLPQAGKE